MFGIQKRRDVAKCCDVLGVVGSNLKMVKIEPTIATPNMSEQGGQMY